MGFALPQETQRRLAVLVVLAVVATAWAVALGSRAVPSIGAASAAGPAHRAPRCPFPASLRGVFSTAARDASLPPALLYAVAKVESNVRQDVESVAGARGLLQVMPATARSMALNPDEASSNVLAGARYLRQMIGQFGSIHLALAAYNAGPTAVANAGGAPSADVLTYVANVEQVWHAHAGCA